MKRRLWPAAPTLCGLACLAVLGPAAPAEAHGDTIRFQISAVGDGHPRATASYEDGDPVDEPVAATLSAVSPDGRAVGPWPLVPLPNTQAGYTTRETLPPGTWKVTVDSGFPELGHGEAEITVTAVPEGAPTPTTTPTPTGTTPTVAAPAAGPTPAPAAVAAQSATSQPAKSRSAVGWSLGAAGAVLVLGLAGCLLALRRRRQTTTR
ncbi:hypothetical protein [Kitasatospora azatica]|uniref:hypothetical protein n=1 Tax=Kitasatospora azatica TaxID=58347 RepID=UPI000689BF6E|nr:hypothetical protein [Kitasatospora azatica]